MESQQNMEKRHLGYHQEHVSMYLAWGGIEEERAAYLGDYTNVVRDLADSSSDDWDLVRAAMLHIAHARELDREHNRRIGEKILSCFEQEARDYLYYLTRDTWRDRPVPKFDQEEMYHYHHMTAREATYYYSRAALAALTSKDEPHRAIELFEDIKTVLDIPFVSYRLPGGDDGVHGGLYRYFILERLPILYERVERFEEALNLVQISFDRPGSGLASYDVAIRRLEGWLKQLSESGGVSTVERFLDMIYEWLDSAGDVDEEERDHLGDCPRATRQFWAWYYGNALGRLIVARPSLRASLIDEIEAGEWETCWHIAGVLFETPPESWGEYRQCALKFYNGSDIEYRQQGGRPYEATQPPHLSAQSDLYWAMRVGFADAHSQNADERRDPHADSADALERIETIVSSTARHVLRVERNTDNLLEAVNNRVMPNDEYWYRLLRERLPSLLKTLPFPTVEHLIVASRYNFAKEPDECNVAICKSVESLFHRIVVPKIMELPEARELMLALPRGKKSPRKRSLKDSDKIQISGWAQILRTAMEGGTNAPLWLVLPIAFPNVDMEAVVSLHVELEKIAQLRGSASHDSATAEEEKAKNAQELWDLVVGSNDRGFLAKFYSAFGLTGEGQESEDADSC